MTPIKNFDFFSSQNEIVSFFIEEGFDLVKGQQLLRSEWLMSKNGMYSLLMTKDGRLELFSCNSKRPVWTKTPADRLVMQSDGNLVLYDDMSNVVWESKTNKLTNGNRFELQNNGNMVVVSETGQVVWAQNITQSKSILIFSIYFYY